MSTPRERRLAKHRLKDAQRELKHKELCLSTVNSEVQRRYYQQGIAILRNEIAELKSIV